MTISHQETHGTEQKGHRSVVEGPTSTCVKGGCEGDGEHGKYGARRPRKTGPIEGSTKQLHLKLTTCISWPSTILTLIVLLILSVRDTPPLGFPWVELLWTLQPYHGLMASFLCSWWRRSVGKCWLCWAWLEAAENTPIAFTVNWS